MCRTPATCCSTNRVKASRAGRHDLESLSCLRKGHHARAAGPTSPGMFATADTGIECQRSAAMTRSIYERQPEESFFRRAPEGWVFTTPGLWPVGGRWTYLVDDAQKAQLLARLGRWRFISVILFTAILAVPLALCGGLSRSGFADWSHFAVFAAISALTT